MKKLIAAILIIAQWGCFDRDRIITGLEGKSLPSFSLLLQDSITYINTGNIPLGKPIVLFYFSPSCPYCRAQMEEIIDDISLLRDIKFYVFTSWPYLELKDFYKYYHLDKYSNIIAGVDYNNFFVDHYKAFGVPYMAIYGKDKKLNEVFVGKINSKKIREVAEN